MIRVFVSTKFEKEAVDCCQDIRCKSEFKPDSSWYKALECIGEGWETFGDPPDEYLLSKKARQSKVDILKEAILKPECINEFETLIEQKIEWWHNSETPISLASILGMNEYEWTAYCQGAELKSLANWRENGWPQKCAICNEYLNYKDFKWAVIQGKTLAHIDCI